VARFLPAIAPRWRRVYTSTGGSPLLLDVKRRQFELTRQSTRLPALSGFGRGRVLSAYTRQIRMLLSDQQFETLCNLCWLPRLTTVSLASRFLDSSGGQHVSSLAEIGILHTLHDDGHAWCYIPNAKLTGLRREYQ